MAQLSFVLWLTLATRESPSLLSFPLNLIWTNIKISCYQSMWAMCVLCIANGRCCSRSQKMALCVSYHHSLCFFSMLIFSFSYLVHFLLICSLLFFFLSFSLFCFLLFSSLNIDFLVSPFLALFLPFPFTFFTNILTVMISPMCTVFLIILLFSDLSCDINSVCWCS